MKIVFVLSLFVSQFISAQIQDSVALDFRTYIGLVKKNHPVVKQANLLLTIGEAEVLRSRGNFDPKIELDYDQKVYEGSDYYEILLGTLKIPTWYGIEFKTQFEQNDGTFLNPERFVPDEGLYSAGISMSLGQGLFINDRMATLKKAKLFKIQTEAEQQLMTNQILYDASIAYFNWLRAYNELKVFIDFSTNAEKRFKGVKRRVEVGDVAAIDSIESKIAFQDRLLRLENSRLIYRKASLELSNFLWLEDNTPVEISGQVYPTSINIESVDQVLQITDLQLTNYAVEEHPKIKALNLKAEQQEIEKRLTANKLLPVVDLDVALLAVEPDRFNNFDTANYKAGLNVSIPLFLRKERGDLALAKAKLSDARFTVVSEQVFLQNKIAGIQAEINSYAEQVQQVEAIVTNYKTLLQGEERKFALGESSLFLVNSREQKLIDARLKRTELYFKWKEAKANLFNVLALQTDL